MEEAVESIVSTPPTFLRRFTIPEGTIKLLPHALTSRPSTNKQTPPFIYTPLKINSIFYLLF